MQNAYMKDKEADIQNAIKEGLAQGEERVKNVVSDIDKRIKQGQEQVQKVVADVDKKLHENPWPIVGGVALGCVLLGFIIGLSKRG